MSDKPELKPCPFCGKHPELSKGAFGPIVNCWSSDEDCGHRGIMMTVAQWNQRADLAKPNEWTSVTTPPEYNVPVLIYNPGWNFEMVARLCQVAGSKDDRWYSIPGWGHELKPTVWHELPALPKTCESDMHELCTEDQRKRCKV